MSRMYMSHVTHVSEQPLADASIVRPVARRHEWCCTCGGVLSHMYMSHVALCRSRVAHMHESHYTYSLMNQSTHDHFFSILIYISPATYWHISTSHGALIRSHMSMS